MPSLPRLPLRRLAALGALLAAGCTPYMRTDMPAPRTPGLRDALASLVGACGAPRPGHAAPDAPESTPGTEGRAAREGRHCDERADRDDGTTPTPPGPTQRKP